MLLLCGYLALFFGLFSFALKRFFHIALWPLAAPAIWLICEYLRANFLTGFPWLSIAYSQSTGIFSSFFPLIGEIGLSALMLLFASVIATAFVIKKTINISSAVLVSLIFISSAFTLNQIEWVKPTGQTTSVALVQGNIEQSIRWRPEQDRPTMEKYLRLTEPLWGNDLIIWPEAAIPRNEPLAIDFIAELDERASKSKSALLTGVVNYNYETDTAFNSMLGLGLDTFTQSSQSYRYMHDNRFSKHHLLPIGEFVPFEALLRPLAPIFDLPMSSFTRGDYVQPNLKAKGLHLVPAICFEIAFPSQISANITPASDAILTVSNDAWFGDSHGPHQHLQIAQIRAMEFGLPVLRATNTGITAAYNHKGDLLGVLPQFEEGVLQVNVPLVNGSTPYAKYANTPIYLVMLLALAIAIWLKRKGSPPVNR